MTLTEALGAEIRAETAAQRLTVSDLARLAAVNRSSLYTWLDAKAAFPIQGLDAISTALKIRPSELMARAERRNAQYPEEHP